MSIKDYDTAAAFKMKESDRPVTITRFEKCTYVEGYDWRIAFDRSGFINEMVYGQVSLMAEGSSLRPSGAHPPRMTSVHNCTTASPHGAARA